MKIIAHIHTDFPQKFGIPRQSGLVESLKGTIVFEPEYRSPDAVKGMEEYDYLWLLWKFQVPEKQNWAATVKPPRLGGNTAVGVFATRSPFRPNPIGLSSVRLEKVELTEHQGPVIHVSGVDLRDGTPIDPNCVYTVATSEYMSTGGNDTGLVAKQLHWEEIGVRMYDALFASIEKHGCLYVTPEQRMHEIGRPENDNAPF